MGGRKKFLFVHKNDHLGASLAPTCPTRHLAECYCILTPIDEVAILTVELDFNIDFESIDSFDSEVYSKQCPQVEEWTVLAGSSTRLQFD